MPEEKKEIPKGTVFTLTVPLDRDKKNSAVFYLKEITETIFLAARAMINQDKDFDATRMMIKALWLGGDSPEVLADNWVASQSARRLMNELLEPVQGDIKKN